MPTRIDRKDRSIYCFRGVNAVPQKQFKPLLSTLEKYGSVFYPPYYAEDGEYFDVDPVAEGTAKNVLADLRAGKTVILFGLSLGGLVLLYVVAKVVSEEAFAAMQRLHVVLVDTPAGVDTMPTIPAPARKLVKAGILSHVPIKKTPKFMSTPPERGNITVPRDVPTGHEEEYKDWAIAQAIDGLTGNRFSHYMSEVDFMGGSGWNNAPLGLLPSGVMSSTYIACCGPENVTVSQPLAMGRWGEFVTYLVELKKGSHCGFLEEFDLWIETLDAVFARICGLQVAHV